VQHTKEMEEAQARQQQLKKTYKLQVKVQAIKDKTLPQENWTVSKIKAMLQWYKPTKKTDKLAQYYQICS
jgi:hypothetical protein